MRARMLELMQYPCSAEYMADVLQVPMAEVKAELARMERRGEIESRCVVTYKQCEDNAKCAA